MRNAGFMVATILLLGAGLQSFAHADNMHAKLSPATLCVSPGTSYECDAAFVNALRSALEEPDVVVRAHGPVQTTRLRGAEPLRFQKRAAWVRRLETIGKEGIPFVRMKRGPESELVIGINRKGMLGFSLKQTPKR